MMKLWITCLWALVLIACGVPPIDHKPIPVSPEIQVTAPRIEQPQAQEAPKPKETEKPKLKQKAPPEVQEVLPCAGIEAATLEDTIRSKLDCITEHSK